jgi:hypothetical protein
MERVIRMLVVVLVLIGSIVHNRPALASFDFDTGNAPIEVIIPVVAPIIFTDVSPSGSDATLVLRITTLVTNAWFDATAPYHATAQGVYSRLDAVRRSRRRPIATSTSLPVRPYRILNSLLPARHRIGAMPVSVGLDPDDATEDGHADRYRERCRQSRGCCGSTMA